MSRPVILDLFCGAGGASMGYHLAGFDVVGVDINPQPNYPFRFLRADVTRLGLPELVKFTGACAVHASPPCQLFTTLNTGNKGRLKPTGHDGHPDLLSPTRPRLDELGRPYVIENVPSAPMRPDIQLCGEMFGLSVIRHRKFELGGWSAAQPAHVKHRGRVAGMRHGEWFEGPYCAVYGDGGGKGSVPQWQRAMGVYWTDVKKELTEAIPPAYTEWVGRRLLEHLRSVDGEVA